MKEFVDYNATINAFLDAAIAWLESRPVRLRDGVNKEQITCDYMRAVKKNPFEYTVHNAVYANCNKLEGFIEHKVDRKGALKGNADLYMAVIKVMDAMGEYYEADHNHNRTKLLEAIKQFYVTLNRKKLLVSTIYKMRPAYFFAQKQK